MMVPPAGDRPRVTKKEGDKLTRIIRLGRNVEDKEPDARSPRSDR